MRCWTLSLLRVNLGLNRVSSEMRTRKIRLKKSGGGRELSGRKRYFGQRELYEQKHGGKSVYVVL